MQKKIIMYVPPVDKKKKELEQKVEQLQKELFEKDKLIQQLTKQLEELRLKPVEKTEEKTTGFPSITSMLKRGIYWAYEVLNPSRVYVEKYHDFVEAEEQEERYFVSGSKGDMIMLLKEVLSTLKGGEKYREQFYCYLTMDGRYYCLPEHVKTDFEEISAGTEFEEELPEELLERLVLSDAKTILWRDLSQHKEGEQVEVDNVLYKFVGKEKRKYKFGEREVYHLNLPGEDKYALGAYSMPDDFFYDVKTGLLLEDTDRKLKSTNIQL